MMQSWLPAVRNALISELADGNLTDRSHNILVRPNGQPKATAGSTFISVHPLGNSSRPGAGNLSHYEEYQIACTITVRARSMPHDEEGDFLYVETLSSLSDIAARVARIVSNDINLRDSVNSAANTINALVSVIEPLKYVGTTTAIPRDPEWFFSKDPYDQNRTPAGYSMDVLFTGGLTVFEKACPEPV